ncbi:MAG: type III pantothenate kinase [Deferribacteraceae bacterium]|jgi:type III pantothenate kinase|nr:type III pantothenate kinase [Deferribacteraceae bacterium]
MILAFDIGNSNINLCFMQERVVLKQFRLNSDLQKTPDEYAAIIFSLMGAEKLNYGATEAVLISSVVPSITSIIGNFVRTHLGIVPIIVNVDSDHGLNVKVDNPYELGIDRLMGALSAYTQFKHNCIIANFGTATTFDLVSKDGDFLGGVIFPGIRLSAAALRTGTALLPQVDIKKPLCAVGTSTVKCIQSGLFYGFLELADGLIDRIKNEKFADEKVELISTGGLGREISSASRHKLNYQPDLISLGLFVMYERVVKRKFS